MELTEFLAKVIGVYMLVVGAALFMNKKHILMGVVSLMHERAAQLITGVIALLLGLVVVNVHNDWSTLPASLISLLAWLGIVKGLVYLLLPEPQLAKIMKTFSERKWYAVDGIVSILLGLYLAGFGYGWF